MSVSAVGPYVAGAGALPVATSAADSAAHDSSLATPPKVKRIRDATSAAASGPRRRGVSQSHSEGDSASDLEDAGDREKEEGVAHVATDDGHLLEASVGEIAKYWGPDERATADAAAAEVGGGDESDVAAVEHVLAKHCTKPYDTNHLRAAAKFIIDKNLLIESPENLRGRIVCWIHETCIPEESGLRHAFLVYGTAGIVLYRRLAKDLRDSGRSLEKEATDEKHRFCKVKVFWHLLSSASLPNRHIGEHVVQRKIVTDVQATLRGFNGLPIIAGESGSGKTVAGILSGDYVHQGGQSKCIVIYTKGSCLPANDCTFRLNRRAARPSPSPADGATTRHGDEMFLRHQRVTHALLRAVRFALPSNDWPTKQCDTNVTVVVDELGFHPLFLRGMCAGWSALCAHLRDLLRVRSVRLVAVGTGTEVVAVDVGSDPSTCRVFTAVEGDVWPKLAEHHNVSPEFLEVLASGDADAAMLRDVVNNARAAALLLQHVSEVTARFQLAAYGSTDPPKDKDAGIAPVARRVFASHVRGLLLSVVLAFKALNSLCALSHEDSAHTALSAIGLVMSRTHEPLSNRDRLLLAKYGVITDLAVCQLEEKGVPDDHLFLDQRITVGSVVYRLMAPKKGRYRMSAAQIAFARLRYGLGARPPTGEGFETLIEDYVIMTLYAALSRRYSADTSLGLPAPDASWPQGWKSIDALIKIIRDVAQRIRINGIAQLDAYFKLQPDKPDAKNKIVDSRKFKAWSSSAKGHIDDGRAVVMLNGAHATYFDAALLAASHLCSIRIKMCDNSTLQAHETSEELNKMGARDALVVRGHLANQVEPRDVATVFGSSASSYVNSQGDIVHPADLLAGLQQDQVPAAQESDCPLTAELLKLVSVGAPVVHHRIIIVAGEAPAPLTVPTDPTATCIFIPTRHFTQALYPLVIPESPGNTAAPIDCGLFIDPASPTL